jgi:hypothetical protein
LSEIRGGVFFCEVGGREGGQSERRRVLVYFFFGGKQKCLNLVWPPRLLKLIFLRFVLRKRKGHLRIQSMRRRRRRKTHLCLRKKLLQKKTKTAKKEHVPERHNMLNLKYKAVFVDGKIVYELRNEIVDTFTDEEWRAFKKMAMITKQSLDQAKQELKNELDRLMGRVVLTDYDNYDYAHESDNEGEGMECEMSFSDTCLSEEEDF